MHQRMGNHLQAQRAHQQQLLLARKAKVREAPGRLGAGSRARCTDG